MIASSPKLPDNTGPAHTATEFTFPAKTIAQISHSSSRASQVTFQLLFKHFCSESFHLTYLGNSADLARQQMDLCLRGIIQKDLCVHLRWTLKCGCGQTGACIAMTLVTAFICSLWVPSKSHQLSALTRTSCYRCQSCLGNSAAKEGARSCSVWCTIIRICSLRNRASRSYHSTAPMLDLSRVSKKSAAILDSLLLEKGLYTAALEALILSASDSRKNMQSHMQEEMPINIHRNAHMHASP